MISLLLRNILFTILQPGIVAGLIPWLILGDKRRSVLYSHISIFQYLGGCMILAGILVLLWCVTRFAFEGKGTLSPLDPTKKLVVSGLYKYTRNPMYVGVMLILAGETIFFQSSSLLIYSLIIWSAFQAFIVFREEPRLLKDFGKDYDLYKKRVRRWI